IPQNASQRAGQKRNTARLAAEDWRCQQVAMVLRIDPNTWFTQDQSGIVVGVSQQWVSALVVRQFCWRIRELAGRGSIRKWRLTWRRSSAVRETAHQLGGFF